MSSSPSRATTPDVPPSGSFIARVSSPRAAFALIALLVGVPMVFLIAPFQAPDELNHFYRAYQISEGGFVATWQDHYGGGVLPSSLAMAYGPFVNIKSHKKVKTSLRQILDAMKIPLHPRVRQRYEFSNVAPYSPASYFPQAAAIFLGRQLRLSPLKLVYLGRLASLLTWTGLGYLSLRIAPALNRPLMLLLMMPMSLFLAASLSADTQTSALAALLAALVLRHCDPRAPAEKFSVLDGAVLCVVTVLFSLSKIAYSPLTAIVLLIPAARFGGWRNNLLFAIAIAGLNLLAVVAWSSTTPGLDAQVRHWDQVNARRQAAYVRAHPTAFLQMAAATLNQDPALLEEFAGRLGWLDTVMPQWFLMSYLIAIVILCWPNSEEGPAPPLWRTATVIPLTFALMAVAIAYLEYIFWTPVGYDHVSGVQGRYFIPAAPGLLILIWTICRQLPRMFWNRASPEFWNAAAAAMALISSVVTLVVVAKRYF